MHIKLLLMFSVSRQFWDGDVGSYENQALSLQVGLRFIGFYTAIFNGEPYSPTSL